MKVEFSNSNRPGQIFGRFTALTGHRSPCAAENVMTISFTLPGVPRGQVQARGSRERDSVARLKSRECGRCVHIASRANSYSN